METGNIAALVALITGLLSAAVTAWLSVRRAQHEQRKELGIRAIEDYKALVEQLRQVDQTRDEAFRRLQSEYDTQLRELRRERDEIMRELGWVMADLASAETQLRIYEARFENELGIQVTPWRARPRGSSHSIDVVSE